MKKFFLSFLLLALFAQAGHAQFKNLDFHIAGGTNNLTDNLFVNTPTPYYAGGVYVTYGFSGLKSVMADIFSLQAGVNFLHRGCSFSETFPVEYLTLYHQGNYDAYYVQVPILARFSFEIPVSTRRGMFASVFLGPEASYGLFGTYSNCVVTPYLPQRDVNFRIMDAPAFKYCERLDVGLMAGIGLQYKKLAVNIYLDYGFLSLQDEVDALKTIENNGKEVTHPGGNSVTWALSLSYLIPFTSSTKK